MNGSWATGGLTLIGGRRDWRHIGVIAWLAFVLPAFSAEPFTAATLPRFAFYPQGGTLWQDLFPTNFVDLDPGTGLLDWHGTAYTYDGHNGIDGGIGAGWAAQDIGVPIFAVLDGVVEDAHDGEFDRNTVASSAPPNFVSINHGGGLVTQYLHMRNGSVAVKKGDLVVAGQQIGLMGSSGNSTAPHLHFAVYLNGRLVEPFAGPARPGDSLWTRQAPFRAEPFVRHFFFTRDEWVTGFPLADYTRTGAALAGTSMARFSMQVCNLPANSTFRFRFLRPDGTLRLETTSVLNNRELSRDGTWYYTYFVNFDRVGRWSLEISVGGEVLLTAPLEVVAAQTGVVNRPPNAVKVGFDGADVTPADAVVCRVQNWSPLSDPDYDVVRYRWLWRRNGVAIREIVSAGSADILMRGLVAPGDTLTCTVTPNDGQIDGPSAVASVLVGANTNRLANMSVLTNLVGRESTLTVGAVIGGAGATGTSAVLVRAVGPSLATLGVGGTLPDPALALFSGQTTVASNDNWGGSAALLDVFRQTGAFEMASPGSRDAAIHHPALSAGAYSVQVTGVDGATGAVLAELYDVSPPSATAASTRLVNMSVLKTMAAGEVFTAGFVIAGSASKQVLIRAVGPTLTSSFGIAGTMVDPRLDLYSGATVAASNDNWSTAFAAAATQVGAFPLRTGSLDAALVITIPAGSYTVQVRDVRGGGGVALVEVYEVP